MKTAKIAWQISLLGIGCALPSLLTSESAWAQVNPYNRQTTQQPAAVKQELHGKGEYEAASNGIMKAVLDGKPWYLKFDKGATVKVMGTATADFLSPGIFVRFKAELDRRGKASAPITELDIFTPDAKNPVGAVTEGGAFAEAPKKGPAATPTAYTVAGRISSMHKGNMTVACGNMTVKADVAPEATIKIDVADPSWAAAGDKIEVKGYFMREGFGMVTDMAVDIANPLTGPRKKTLAKKPADKTADKTDKADKTDPLASGDKKLDPKKPDATKPDPKKPADSTDDKKIGGLSPFPDAKPDTTKPGVKADPAATDTK
jgi:hypothetical protein